MSNHALLSASSSHRWLNCPPSARLGENYEDKGSDFAAEGTDAHSLCEHKLKTALGIPSEDPTENLTWYNEEMEECASGYAAYVLELLAEAKKVTTDPIVLIEQRLDYASTDVQNNTTSDCCFKLGSTSASTLKQVITGLVTGGSYVFSLRAKKTTAGYSSYARLQYNGSKYAYAFNTTSTFGWTEYSFVLDDVQDSTITLYIYNRYADLYVSDMMLAEGNAVHKWTPAPNEIYTEEVKIDHRGIEVSNAASSQRTVITNTEFSGYYNEEKIFTLNKDETQTKKTTVDGELTVGKTKFVPMPTASEGLNIVILD